MRKIPTLFRRDPDDMRHVLPEVTPGCEWVLAGEGVPTRKFDGTCVLVRGSGMLARREVKKGKTEPPGFERVDYDEVTGKAVGWVPVTDAPEWARHWEAFGHVPNAADGTYELCGPKVNGNPEHLDGHFLIQHGCWELDPNTPRHYDGLVSWLIGHSYEGIVWWRDPGDPDAGMAKLKRRDFT